jgi:hypothetical protein
MFELDVIPSPTLAPRKFLGESDELALDHWCEEYSNGIRNFLRLTVIEVFYYTEQKDDKNKSLFTVNFGVNRKSPSLKAIPFKIEDPLGIQFLKGRSDSRNPTKRGSSEILISISPQCEKAFTSLNPLDEEGKPLQCYESIDTNGNDIVNSIVIKVPAAYVWRIFFQ